MSTPRTLARSLAWAKAEIQTGSGDKANFHWHENHQVKGTTLRSVTQYFPGLPSRFNSNGRGTWGGPATGHPNLVLKIVLNPTSKRLMACAGGASREDACVFTLPHGPWQTPNRIAARVFGQNLLSGVAQWKDFLFPLAHIRA
jgi:hypothetical protein